MLKMLSVGLVFLSALINPLIAEEYDINKVHLHKIIPKTASVSSQTVETNTITFSYNNSDPTQLSHYDNPLTNQSVNFSYDANGNMLNDQDNHQLSYDAFDNLIQVSSADGSETNSYSYDGLGERISQTEIQTGSIGQPIYFYYNQGQLSDENQINDEGLTLSSTHYVDGAQLQSGQWHYNVSDARGNVISSLDMNGSISGYNTYTPFGYQKNIYPNQESFNPLNISQLDQGYNGMVTDRVTGNQFLGNGYRVYNPVLGRFMKHDSESPYGAGGINGYTYVNNDPINATDPTGHMSQGGKVALSFTAMFATVALTTFAPEAVALIPGLVEATETTELAAETGETVADASSVAADAKKAGNARPNAGKSKKLNKKGKALSMGINYAGSEAIQAAIGYAQTGTKEGAKEYAGFSNGGQGAVDNLVSTAVWAGINLNGRLMSKTNGFTGTSKFVRRGWAFVPESIAAWGSTEVINRAFYCQKGWNASDTVSGVYSIFSGTLWDGMTEFVMPQEGGGSNIKGRLKSRFGQSFGHTVWGAGLNMIPAGITAAIENRNDDDPEPFDWNQNINAATQNAMVFGAIFSTLPEPYKLI